MISIEAGTPVHIRDSVMTSCIEAVTIDQPGVMSVKPGEQARAVEHIWVSVPRPNVISHIRSLVAADHWHYPEECPDKSPTPPL